MKCVNLYWTKFDGTDCLGVKYMARHSVPPQPGWAAPCHSLPTRPTADHQLSTARFLHRRKRTECNSEHFTTTRIWWWLSHHHLHVATMTQWAAESIWQTVKTPTCQVCLRQGFDLPVGSGGEDFSQRALGGARTLITSNKTTIQWEKLECPSQSRRCV